jgi:hypothetical protein
MEEYRYEVFDKRIMGRIFGLKRKDVTGGCSALHSLQTASKIQPASYPMGT